MAEIRAIIFDAGGVLLDGSAQHFIERCEKELGLKHKIELLEKGGAIFGREMALGEKTPKQELNELFGGNLSGERLEKVMQFFIEEWNQRPEMIALVKKLKKRYMLGLLSNTEKENAAKQRKQGLFKLFDAVVLSNEVHIVKPDERIFHLMLERIGRKAGECIFIDDKESNVEAAKKLGFKTIHFKSKKQCEKELKRLGTKF